MFERQEQNLLAFGVADIIHGLEPLIVDFLCFDGSFEVHDVTLLLFLLIVSIGGFGL